MQNRKKRTCISGLMWRTASGQGLIESACGSIVITMLFVGLLAFAINCYAVATTDSQLRLVAEEAARAYDDHQYFLGLTRPDYSDEQAQQDATNLALALAETYDIPLAAKDVSFKVRDMQIPIASASAPSAPIITPGITCSIAYNKMKLPFGGGVFPLFISRKISATIADMSLPAPTLLDISAATANGTGITVSVPAYFGYHPYGVKTDKNGDPILGIGGGKQITGGAKIGTIRANSYYGIQVPPPAHITDPLNASGKYTVQ